MGTLIGYEFRKTLAPKLTRVILAVLLLLNGIVIDYTARRPLPETENVTRAQVSQVYADHAGQSPEQIAAWLQSWLEEYAALWWMDDGTFRQLTQEQIQTILTYTDSIRQEASLIQTVLDQVTPLTEYTNYLNAVQENAESLTQSALFSDENSFPYRSLKKTAQIYRPLYAVTLTAADSSGVTVALEGHATTVLLFFAMVLLVLNLVLSEREEGLLLLIKPTFNGRGKTIAAKLWALALWLLVFTVLFYGSNLFLCASRFGLGDLGRSIQSLDGYLTSPLRICVGEYIAWFLCAKYLGLLTGGLVLFLLCVFCKRRIPACVAGAGVLMLEMALYTGIPNHSWLWALREMNLVAALDTVTYFSDYENLNLFGWPVSMYACSGAFCLLVSGGSVLLAYRRWCREETVASVRGSRHIRQRRGNVFTSLLRHETYKLFSCCMGGILLLLLLMVQLVSYSGLAAYEGEDEVWYQHYSQILAGPYHEENILFLQQEQAHFDTIAERQQEYMAQAERGEITREYAFYLVGTLAPEDGRERGFQRAKTQYLYLKSQQEAGKSVSYVPTTGYNFLLDDVGSDILDAAKLCFVLAVCLSMYFTMEDTTGMIRLIRPSRQGEGSVLRKKGIVCGVWLLLICVAAFAPRILASLAIYPMENAGCPAVSLPQFQYAPRGLTIAAYFALVNLSRLLAVYLVALVVFCICKVSKHPTTAFVLSLVVLELPAGLSLLGIAGECALLPLLTGHWLLA